MNTEVDIFSAELRFLVQPHVTIQQLYDRVASDLRLKHRDMFGLQAYNERQQEVVWLKPTDSLAVAIKKGMRFKPLAIRFFLRAHTFPAEWDTLGDDASALQLFYKQTSERFYQQGYRTDSAAQIALAALVLLIDHGPLATTATAATEIELMRLATRHLVLRDTDPTLNNRVAKTVLHLWDLFGAMTAKEATFNYLNILKGAGYSYEKVRFVLTNHTEKKLAALDISFNGLEVCQPAEDGLWEMRKFPWPKIRGIDQQNRWLTVRILDHCDAGSLVLMANCQFVARQIHSLVKSYHGVHLNRLSGQKMASTAQLMLSQPEHFFSGILHNLVAVDRFSKQLSVAPLGLGELHEDVSEPESQVEELQSAPQQLSAIIEELTTWIEMYGENFNQNEALRSNINQLSKLSNEFHKQMKIFEVFEDPASIESMNSQVEQKVDAVTAQDKIQYNTLKEQVSQDNCKENFSIDDLQIEETASDEQNANQLMVPVEVYVSDAFAHSSTESMVPNSSESGDELVSDHSADMSSKNPKLVLLESFSQQQSAKKSFGNDVKIISQVNSCFEDMIKAFETEEGGGCSQTAVD